MKRVMVQHKNIIFAFIGTAILYGFIMFFFNFYFDINDDVTIKNILNGSFSGTPDAHAVYIQYPLAFIISALYRIFPIIPWYGLLINGCQAFCIAVIIYFVQKKHSIAFFSVAVSILSILSLALSNLVFTQYTVTAATLAGTSIILICLSENRKKEKSLGIVLYVLSFCIRIEIFLLSLPFLGFAIFSKLVLKKAFNKKTIGEYVKVIGILLGSCLLFALINKIAYLGTDWSNYTKFNDERTKIYDYQGLPQYEDNQQTYANAGLTETDYISLYYYNINPNKNITFDKLNALSNEIDSLPKDNIRSRLGGAYIQYKYRSTHSQDYPWNYFIIMLYVIWITYIIFSSSWLDLILPVISIGMRSSIWMYIIFQGRYPERITDSLYIIESLLLMYLIFVSSEKLQKKAKIVLTNCVLILIGIYSVVNLGKEFSTVSNKQEVYKSVQTEYEEIFDYMREQSDSLFLLDVYSFVGYTEEMVNNSYDYQNYELMGGWLAQSPLQQARDYHNNDYDNKFIVSKDEGSIACLKDLGYSLSYCNKVGKFNIWKFD